MASMTPAQKRLVKSLDSGWLEHTMAGTYAYRSPGYGRKSLNEKTVKAVKAEVPLVRLFCKSPIRGVPAHILIRRDRLELLDDGTTHPDHDIAVGAL